MNLPNVLMGTATIAIGALIYLNGASNNLNAALSSDQSLAREATRRMLLQTVNCDASLTAATCGAAGQIVPLLRVAPTGAPGTVVSATDPPTNAGGFALRAECTADKNGLVVRAVRLAPGGGLTSTAAASFLQDAKLAKAVGWSDPESLLFGPGAEICSLGRVPFLTDHSAAPVQAATCDGTQSGVWCDGSYFQDVLFTTAFASPPAVIVVMAKSNNLASPCANTADRIDARAVAVTKAGFRLYCAASPDDVSCANPAKTQMLSSACTYFAVER